MLAMLLPGVVIVILIVFLIIGVCMQCCRRMKKKKESKDEKLIDRIATSGKSAANLKAIMGMDKQKQEEEDYKRSSKAVRDRILGAFIIFLALAYLFLGANVMSVFKCRKDENGDYVYVDQPSLICFKDETHAKMLIASLVFLPLYILAFPIALLAYIRKKRNNLSDSSVAMRIGFLVNPYQRKFAYWEGVVMIKKIALVIIITIISEWPLFAAGICLVVLFLSIVAHVNSSPYAEHRLHKEELFLMVCSKPKICVHVSASLSICLSNQRMFSLFIDWCKIDQQFLCATCWCDVSRSLSRR
jgi:heme/copper-type cytochrome/quinol oxidase subunit 2